MKRCQHTLLCLAYGVLAHWILHVPDAQAQFRTGKPKAKLSLLSAVDSVASGRPVEVGIRFKLEKGWHIYWINSGQSGLPPNVKWTLPDGFTAGKLRFPVPKRYLSPPDITTNILDDDPMLLVMMTPPASGLDGPVTLQADVAYLICKTQCLRETAKVSLELPVASAGAAQPVNTEVFLRARDRLPVERSPHVSLTASSSANGYTADTKFALELTVEAAPGVAVPAHGTKIDGITSLDLFVEPIPGIWMEDTVFPVGDVRRLGALGDVGIHEGRFTIRVPAEVDETPVKTPLRFAGLFVFQPCSERGACESPTALEFEYFLGGGGAVTSAAQPVSTVVDDGASDAPDDGTTDRAAHVAGASVEDGAAFGGDQSGFVGFFSRMGLPGLLLLCFLYGLGINATPCVLPLLSIKVLGFVQQAHESRRRTFALGLSFGLGVLVFFLLLGFLAAAGTNILQYPQAVIALGAILTALSLSMLGVYTLQVPAAATKLDAGLHQEGLAASFGKGALAPVLGFACTGPLLAAAWGWATKQPPMIAGMAFLSAGVGMASPYVILGAKPKWLSFLPKPGKWMIAFERIMGFLLLGMVVWMVHPLIKQIGGVGLEWTYVFYIAVAFACWLWGKVDFGMAAASRWRFRGGAIVTIVVSAGVVYGWIHPLGEAVERQREALWAQQTGTLDWSHGIPWQRWTPTAVNDSLSAGRPVFLDVTADWCTVCKANKAVATYTAEVCERLRACGAVPLQADYTLTDPGIAALLKQYDRAGPPLNVVFSPDRPDQPSILRPNLTKAYLLEQLDGACSATGGGTG